MLSNSGVFPLIAWDLDGGFLGLPLINNIAGTHKEVVTIALTNKYVLVWF